MSHQVYLSLGTNLGDRLENLRNALQGLPLGVKLLRASPVYETPPWGLTQQPAFLNLAVEVSTSLEPLALLEGLKCLEVDLGRKPAVRYGPRLIDLDILFYDDLCIDQPGLVIPHAHLHERAFVLVPLADLTPGLRHPRLGRTVCELLAGIEIVGINLFATLELSQ